MKMSWISFLLMTVLAAGSSAFGAEEMNPSRALEAADWSKMETVTVTLSEFAFTPASLELREGVSTKLVLRNQGTVPHYFVAEEFFGTIASRKVQSSDGEVKAPRFTAVEVYPGKTIEWFLVPLRKGSYGLLCTVKGHAGRGMTGTIVVR